MEECKKVLKPTELEVGIKGVRNTRNIGIAVVCKSVEVKDKLQHAVKTNLGNQYEVKTPGIRKPVLKIVGLRKKMDEKEIKDSLLKQNSAIFTKEKAVEVKKVIKLRHSYLVLVGTDVDTFAKVI